MDDEEREWHNLQFEFHTTADDDVIMRTQTMEMTRIQTTRIRIQTRTVNPFQDVTSSASVPALFRMSRRSGSVLITSVSTSTLSQYMTSVTTAERLKPLWSLGHPESVSAIVRPPGCPLIINKGKTVWLLYAIWYDGLESCIFVDDGVYKMAADFHVNEFKTFVWTLSTWTRPRTASHQSLSGIVLVFLSFTLLLQTSSAGNTFIRMWRMPP
jgi:hypothetical protein